MTEQVIASPQLFRLPGPDWIKENGTMNKGYQFLINLQVTREFSSIENTTAYIASIDEARREIQ